MQYIFLVLYKQYTWPWAFYTYINIKLGKSKFKNEFRYIFIKYLDICIYLKRIVSYSTLEKSKI